MLKQNILEYATSIIFIDILFFNKCSRFFPDYISRVCSDLQPRFNIYCELLKHILILTKISTLQSRNDKKI